MNLKVIGWIAGIIVFFVIIGGVGYKIVAPTSKTIVGAGGKAITINTESPNTPIAGCSIWRFNMKATWDHGFNLKSNEEKK